MLLIKSKWFLRKAKSKCFSEKAKKSWIMIMNMDNDLKENTLKGCKRKALRSAHPGECGVNIAGKWVTRTWMQHALLTFTPVTVGWSVKNRNEGLESSG